MSGELQLEAPGLRTVSSTRFCIQKGNDTGPFYLPIYLLLLITHLCETRLRNINSVTYPIGILMLLIYIYIYIYIYTIKVRCAFKATPGQYSKLIWASTVPVLVSWEQWPSKQRQHPHKSFLPNHNAEQFVNLVIAACKYPDNETVG